ncbi:MAG: hypothetical protein HYR96_08360 [Deltaproteobacteria bacterium]|nr:hypothetical protein [Deltaproteobacteria bacterium]MBI3294977.1 hypothetical protein [Deltaproteobacteria bacterium]
MVTQAKNITADRLTERLPIGNPNDELGLPPGRIRRKRDA